MFKAKSLKSAPAATLESMIGALEPVARETGFWVRSPRKISPAGFLLSLLKSVCCGQASLNQLAMFFGRGDLASPSRQAVHKRLGKASNRFLRVVLDKLLDWKCHASTNGEAGLFARVLLQDSSQFKTHRANHESYPGLGNNSGPTAGSKTDSCTDIMSSQPLLAEQTAARVQDRVLGPKLLEHVAANDLVLRDMGYFALKDFRQIEAKKAFWLSRLPSLVNATLPDGRSLEEFLKSSPAHEVDLEVALGADRHKVRLIALRVTHEVCAMRRRQRRAKSKKQGHTPQKKSLLRDHWSIYVTNIPKDKLDATAAVRLYSTRWSVEIQFRAWKQSTKVEAALNRITNRYHLEAILLSAMIFQVLTVKLVQMIGHHHRRSIFSIEKVADWLACHLLSISSLTEGLSHDPRHLSHDKRKRPFLRDSLRSILALS